MVEETEAEYLKVRAGMYIDCNDKNQRKAVFAFVRFTADVTEKNHQTGATIHLDYLRKIEAVIERLEEIVEDQEERIAIMEEGRDSG